MTRFVLLPSPLLGPAVWQPVAAALTAAGQEATSVPVTAPVSTPAGVLAGFLDAVPQQESVVLVGHSNAGLYLPAVAEHRKVRALLFVDAALPSTTGQTTWAAAPRFRAFLEGRADGNGVLPPWSQWWDDGSDDLFPDAATRRRVEVEQQRLPLSYFEAPVPVPEGWETSPCAYLAFGDTYAEETATAKALGWPVSLVEGRHLEMLLDPSEVAAELQALLARVEEP